MVGKQSSRNNKKKARARGDATLPENKPDIPATSIDKLADQFTELINSPTVRTGARKNTLANRSGWVSRDQVTPQTFALEDGDQEPMRGLPADKLRENWASGMDFSPAIHGFGVHGSAMVGSLSKECKLLAEIAKNDPSQKRAFFESRVSKMNFSPLMMCIQGVRTKMKRIDGEKSVNDIGQTAFLEWLVKEMHVNVDGRDVIGNTAVFHATGLGSSAETLKMARFLLENGANPNARNRFGCTPLHDAVMIGSQPSIRLLLSLGADPEIPDYDGITPLKLSESRPTIFKLFADEKIKQQQQQQSSHPSNASTCATCSERSTLFCTCMNVRYCSTECQKAHWSTHKKVCNRGKATEGEIVKVTLTDTGPTNGEMVASKMMPLFPQESRSDVKQHSSRVVKIQYGGDKFGLLVYDEGRTFQKYILPSDPGFAPIVKAIKEQGIFGKKAYFRACVEDPVDDIKSLTIKIDVVVAPRDW